MSGGNAFGNIRKKAAMDAAQIEEEVRQRSPAGQLQSDAQRLYNKQKKIDPYAGQLYAGPTATMAAAQDLSLARAGGATSSGLSGLQLAQGTLSGQYLNAETNPYLQSYTQAATRPLTQNLTENVLPSIGANALASGGYGGSRQGIAEGLATARTQQQIGDVSTNIAMNAYEAERGRQLQAIDLAKGAMGLSMLEPDIQYAIGAQQQASNQGLLDEALRLYEMGITQPWMALQNYSGIVNPYYLATQQQQQEQGAGSDTLGGVTGGAMMGYQVAGPWGALAGGIAGGLLG